MFSWLNTSVFSAPRLLAPDPSDESSDDGSAGAKVSTVKKAKPSKKKTPPSNPDLQDAPEPPRKHSSTSSTLESTSTLPSPPVSELPTASLPPSVLPSTLPSALSGLSSNSDPTSPNSKEDQSSGEPETFQQKILRWLDPRRSLCLILSGLMLASLGSTLTTAVLLTTLPFSQGAASPSNQGPGTDTLRSSPPQLLRLPNHTISGEQISTILARNLFDPEGAITDEPEEEKRPNQSGEIPATELPIKLLGTLYGSDPRNGIAMIENTELKSQNSFLVGDRLEEGVVIKEIHRRKVILDHLGQLESLSLEQDEIQRRPRRGSSSPLSNMPSLVQRDPTAQSKGRLSQYKEDGYEFSDNKVYMTDSYKKKLLIQDFSKVLQDAKADPYMVEGRLAGFILTRIRQNSIYEKAGFANGDIIKEINGIELTSASQAIGVLQAARNAQRLEVTVIQNGQINIIEVNIGQ